MRKSGGIMVGKLFKRFRFSPTITIVCLLLAAVMLWCSRWQWDRYKAKVALVNTYAQNSLTPPLPFPVEARTLADFQPLLNRRVRVRGSYDYSRQIIVTNRKHASGPGHWLVTPFRISGTEHYVLVSRGFIPFADRTPETWAKYDFDPEEELDAVVKPSANAHIFGPSNPETGPHKPFQTLWFFPEIPQMAKQLPYPTISSIYLQRLGPPPQGQYPAQSILVEVPPQTHFGYTIEWILLAAATLTIGFLLQAFPRKRQAP